MCNLENKHFKNIAEKKYGFSIGEHNFKKKLYERIYNYYRDLDDMDCLLEELNIKVEINMLKNEDSINISFPIFSIIFSIITLMYDWVYKFLEKKGKVLEWSTIYIYVLFIISVLILLAYIVFYINQKKRKYIIVFNLLCLDILEIIKREKQLNNENIFFATSSVNNQVTNFKKSKIDK